VERSGTTRRGPTVARDACDAWSWYRRSDLLESHGCSAEGAVSAETPFGRRHLERRAATSAESHRAKELEPLGEPVADAVPSYAGWRSSLAETSRRRLTSLPSQLWAPTQTDGFKVVCTHGGLLPAASSAIRALLCLTAVWPVASLRPASAEYLGLVYMGLVYMGGHPNLTRLTLRSYVHDRRPIAARPCRSQGD